MNLTARILCAIGEDSPSTVSEIWDGMGSDRPSTMTEINAFLRVLETFAEQNLVLLWRATDRRITTAQLTELGAERAREARAEGARHAE